MQIQTFNFEEFKPEIYKIVKEVVNEVVKKEKHEKKEISNYELLERIVKVEEELKHQRELIFTFMKQVEKRFEQVEKRFEQIDKRFEQIDKRFEQIDKRFEQVDKRFEQIEKRFEQMDKRFELLTLRIDRFMFWSLGLVISATAIIIGYMHYFLK